VNAKLAAAARCEARARGYELLATLFAEPPRGELLERARSSSEAMEDALGSLTNEAGEPAPTANREALAAQYHQALERGVPPYAGVFLNHDGLVGGHAADAVARFAALCELPLRYDLSPDHLTVILEQLAELSQREARAHRVGSPGAIRAAERLSHACLQTLLLPWIAPFAAALRRVATPFYRALLDETLGLLEHHVHYCPRLNTLPQPAARFLDPNRQAKDGASISQDDMAYAQRVGLYLPPSDITWLARRAGVAHGFGSRALTLGRLFDAAERAGSFDALQGALLELVDHSRKALQDIGAGGPHAAPWLARLADLEAFLAHLANAREEHGACGS